MILKYFSSRNAIFFLVGISAVFITVGCIYSAVNMIKHANEHIERDVDIVKTVMQDQIDNYVYGLQGARGVFIADGLKFDHKIFKKYAESRDNFSNFNGSLGFGFIRYVRKKDLDTYTKTQKKIRKEFNVHPVIDVDEHMVIELIEPLERNKRALGLDVAFETNRREAAYLSAQSGKSALTKKIQLVQQNEKHFGFLMFLPIYSSIKAPDVAEERMNQLIGWAYSPILLDELLNKIKKIVPSDLSIDLEIEQNEKIKMGSAPGRDSLILKTKKRDIEIANQHWRLTGIPASNDVFSSIVLILFINISTVLLMIIGAAKIYRNLVLKDKNLYESENLMKGIIHNAGHFIITTSAEGIITSFNRAAEIALGYKAYELIGKKTPLTFHDIDEVSSRFEALQIAIGKKFDSPFEVFVHKAKKGIIDTNEWLYVCKDGKRISVRLSVTAIFDEERNIVGFLGVAEDLTEYNKMLITIENQRANMIETAKLSQLGEMASSVAHEINTPLTVIMGKANQLIEVLKKEEVDKKTATDQINKISKMADQISKIVKSLKTVSRNAEKDPFEKVNVRSIIDSTIELCKEKIDKHNIILNVNVTNDTIVPARASELSQVTLNLISNSIDAISENNEKWIKIESVQMGEHVYLSIIDSGSGIPSHVVEKMMNPFFTTKEVGKGTGLGLSISKNIIEGHGGRLYYDKESSNTKFIIELPCNSNKENKENKVTA